jgi:hypothetical protein
VKFPYLEAPSRLVIPSLGNSLVRPRPIIAVRVRGPAGAHLLDAFLDTGSDDTVFEAWVAALIGVDLTQAETRAIQLVGRPQIVDCRYARVEFSITDGRGTFQWTAFAGFVSTRLRYPLLGYAGFLQFFDAEFRGADREVKLTANRDFPGTGP